MARELLLKGGYVATVDDSLRDLPSGDVLIRDDQVVAVARDLNGNGPLTHRDLALEFLGQRGLADARLPGNKDDLSLTITCLRNRQ